LASSGSDKLTAGNLVVHAQALSPNTGQLAAQRLAPIPLLHRKLHRVALGMDTPYWVDVAEPDWDRHISESDLPGPPTALYLGDAELVVPIGLGPTRTSISNACKIPLPHCWGGR